MKLATYVTTVLVMFTTVEAQNLAPQAKPATEKAQVLYCWVKVSGRSSAPAHEELLRAAFMTMDRVADVQYEYDKPGLLRAAITLDKSFPAEGTERELMDGVGSAVEQAGLKVVHIGDTPRFPWYKRGWVWGAAVALVGGAAAIATMAGMGNTGDGMPGMEH